MSASSHVKTMQAFGLAILLEVLLLVGATVVLASATQVKPAISEPVTITLVSEEEPPPPPKPKPPPPKAKLQPAPPVLSLPPPMPTPVAPVPVVEMPTAFTEPVKPPPPPPPPPVSGRPDQGLEYAAKVRAAVQAAVFYPPAAAALRFSGRVRVEFHLQDGIPGEAHVLFGSGMGIIDRAALQSVQGAHYPEPPADLRGADRVYQVWVEFNH
jgi:periplasmic protein TonB